MSLLSDQDLSALLGEIERHAPDPGELHHLDVFFQHLGPSPPTRADRVAVLCAGASRTPLAVRGMSQLRLVELETGSHRIMLELRPHAGHGVIDVHGQLYTDAPFGDDALAVLSWSEAETRARAEVSSHSRIQVCSTSGRELREPVPARTLRTSAVDAHGEFHFHGLPIATYRVTWHLAGERIVLPEMTAHGPGRGGL